MLVKAPLGYHTGAMANSFTTIIEPRLINFDGFPVRRSLPRIGIRSVGPWVFFDHMGPHSFQPGEGMDVLPHPHINLATVTYLFEGAIQHRDTLGNNQRISPGAINLMVAGRGIAHSERSPEDLRTAGHRVHGLQLWHALPTDHEEDEPRFLHYPAEQLPTIDYPGARVRVMMGSAYGTSSPVISYQPTLYIELRLEAGASVQLPTADERGIYLIKGGATVDGESLSSQRFALLDHGATILEASESETIVVLIGGASLGKRYMWWNFVSSRKERIKKAKHDWASGAFGPVIGDEDQRVPLPESDNYGSMD